MEKPKAARPTMDKLLHWIRKLFTPCRRHRVRQTTVAQLADMNNPNQPSSTNELQSRQSLPAYSNADNATPTKGSAESGSEYGFIVYSNNVKENSGLCGGKTCHMDVDMGLQQVLQGADVVASDKWLYNTCSQYSHVYEEITSESQVRHSDWHHWPSDHSAAPDFLDQCAGSGFPHQPHPFHSPCEGCAGCSSNWFGFRCKRRVPLVDAYHITPLISKSISMGDHARKTLHQSRTGGAASRPNQAEMQRLFQLFLKDLATGRRPYLLDTPDKPCYPHYHEYGNP
ncbi:hypothetical protein RvY_02185-1 [Ramazzottius varieornatus]|uniref:Uncharacterized protein n=1 Tax=Ramazzottius varieornatus TaxID=947166 RepID=A0A1D1UQV6_RAMVA|nr:hypothetical protein RvY_02185-1 [Ramazzottius varieornatus]